MNVLLISISLEGGAGGATYRLHQSLQTIGVISHVLVQNKSMAIDDGAVIVGAKNMLAKVLDKSYERANYFPLKCYANRDIYDLFSLQWLPDSIQIKKVVAQLCPDVINLHWICGGNVKIETLPKLNKPLVWTLHDMWAFTGGCHLSLNCDRYTEACGACPQLHSSKSWDLSRWVWIRKARAWKDLDLTIVTPSSWLSKCARSSSLFRDIRIEIIPNGIDTKRFKPTDRQVARELLNLPQNKKVALFGAWQNTQRKGFHLLQKALQSLSKSGWRDNMEVVVFGFSQPKKLLDLGFKTYFLGRVSNDILPKVYSAANVFIAPYILENFPTTVLESLSCGTPVVAFNASGTKDIIEHKRNGYLAKPYDVEDLAFGIKWILDDVERHQRLTYQGREKIEKEFNLELMAQRYSDLFYEIVR